MKCGCIRMSSSRVFCVCCVSTCAATSTCLHSCCPFCLELLCPVQTAWPLLIPGPCSCSYLALAHTGPCSYLDLAHTWPLLMSGPCSYLALTHTSSCLATSSASQACLHSPSLYLIIYYLCVYLVGTQEGCCLKAGWADGT